MLSISCLARYLIIYQVDATNKTLNSQENPEVSRNPVLACNKIFVIRKLRRIYLTYTFVSLISFLFYSFFVVILISTWMKKGFPPWEQSALNNHFHPTFLLVLNCTISFDQLLCWSTFQTARSEKSEKCSCLSLALAIFFA